MWRHDGQTPRFFIRQYRRLCPGPSSSLPPGFGALGGNIVEFAAIFAVSLEGFLVSGVMEDQGTRGEQERDPFQWRKNTLDERRRMRSDRKKRKRSKIRKEMSIDKEGTIKELAKCLQRETEKKERLLYLARKYYLKWRQNKEAKRILQEKAANPRLWSSRFGTIPKVGLNCCCLRVCRASSLQVTPSPDQGGRWHDTDAITF